MCVCASVCILLLYQFHKHKFASSMYVLHSTFLNHILDSTCSICNRHLMMLFCDFIASSMSILYCVCVYIYLYGMCEIYYMQFVLCMYTYTYTYTRTQYISHFICQHIFIAHSRYVAIIGYVSLLNPILTTFSLKSIIYQP